MARGQISDEDLSSGLKGLSGFGALGGAKVIKDSPFRDSRSEPKIVEVAKAPERPVVVKKAPAEPERPLAAEVKPVAVKGTPKPVAVRKVPTADTEAAVQGRRVADIYTERVTLQLSPEMRDRVDALARELQRSKSNKAERITANTVMRVAIQHVLKNFKLNGGDAPSGEEELLSVIEKRCTWK
jgi:hypothetical protein